MFAAAASAVAADALEPLEPNLSELLENTTLRWIFVGGKGGVGKTTVSSSLAVALAERRESVLIISTDPAHNLSDAFDQKFSKEPTKVHGFDNLSAMEIDPTMESKSFAGPDQSGLLAAVSDIANSLPGMDELMTFMHLTEMVKRMNFSVVVFDTAPTGHTLHLLHLPETFEKVFGRLMGMGSGLGGMISQMSSMLGMPGVNGEQQLNKMQSMRASVDEIRRLFTSPDITTFVCVCIPEFLSLYETERLVQDLMRSRIDCSNIVVNQVVMPPSNAPPCQICQSRVALQSKYVRNICELYEEDFHVCKLPLLTTEIRGADKLRRFGRLLRDPAAAHSLLNMSGGAC